MSDPHTSAGLTIEHDFDAAGRSVDIGRGVQWLISGWETFVKAPGVWVAISIVFMLIIGLFSVVPFVGGIAEAFLTPVLVGGLLIGIRELEGGAALRFDHLFIGFRGEATAKLITVGGFSLAGMVIVVVVMFAVGGGALLSGAMVEHGMVATGALIGILLAAAVGLALLLPLSMALWFAPPLVLFGAMAPGAALKSSFMGCLKNVLAFTVYGVVLFVLLVVAAVPFFLGYLVLIPVVVASIHAAYRDIYE